MSRIVIDCRFPKEKSQDEIDEFKEELSLSRLMDGEIDEKEKLDDFMSKEIRYEYVPVCINLKDVSTYNPLDEKHIVLRTYSSGSYTARMEFSAFLNVYEDLTGFIIKDLRNLIILKATQPEEIETKKEE